ncbi:fatty acid desaturase 4, chloroplastic isoform X1 [Ananas comosus]|uniref:Fatty acid desaturase 4, chloroplastic isoform X1 n=1 Tax=Ananas comosus TaxID=4615 RepID=A0A6P5G3C0_ANACO|nr:fatty acid desaturase 4, chloroplastic isoform X1 [Ananas comosus]
MYALTPRCHLSSLPRFSPACRVVTTSRPPPLPPPPAVSVATTSSSQFGGPADPSSLRSTWPHRAWVATGSATVIASLVKSVSVAAACGAAVEPLLGAVLGYLLADLGTGVYHWAIDNYGGPSTPVFGAQIEGFQGHHKYPYTITRREFANNLHALARAVTFTVPPIQFLISGISIGDGSMAAAAHAFVGVCAGCIMLSQQFHAWAHEKKGRLPPAVAALQEAGVLVSRAEHAAHHRPPYNSNYCIVSGACNRALDESRVFEAMEMVVFFRFGVRPRSWSEPASERKEQTARIAGKD